MEINKLFCLVLSMMLLLCGCFSNPDNNLYQFRQPLDQIASIEILRKTEQTASINDPVEVLYYLPEENQESFLNALQAVPGERIGMDPYTGLGPYIVRITYLDGEVARIGYANTVYDLPDGEIRYYYFLFDYSQFHDLIAEVLGIDISVDLIS